VHPTDTPRIRGTQDTQDASPGKKKEKQETRLSIQANRKRSAEKLGGSMKIPDLTDYVKLTPRQKKNWRNGKLYTEQLTEAQKRQYEAFEKKLPKELTAPFSEESSTGASGNARPSSLSSAKKVKDERSKVFPHSTEQSPSKPTGKSSPRIESRGGTPRVAGVPGTPTAEWNWPRHSQSNVLEKKIRFQQQKIAGLMQQLAAEEGRLELLQQKRHLVAAESSPRLRTALQSDLQAEGGNDTSSLDLSAIVEKMIPSSPYRKQ
jgi:hypothetical protein